MPQPILYLMFGYPGAGKSTAAKIIAEQTGATRLSSDDQRLEMFDQPEFTMAEHDKLYRELYQNLEKLLSAGKSVVFDANLNRYEYRQIKYDICARTGAKPSLIWVRTPRQIAKNRATHISRQPLWPKDEMPSDMFERIAGDMEPPRSNEPIIEMDGTKISNKTVAKALGLAPVNNPPN